MSKGTQKNIPPLKLSLESCFFTDSTAFLRVFNVDLWKIRDKNLLELRVNTKRVTRYF